MLACRRKMIGHRVPQASPTTKRCIQRPSNGSSDEYCFAFLGTARLRPSSSFASPDVYKSLLLARPLLPIFLSSTLQCTAHQPVSGADSYTQDMIYLRALTLGSIALLLSCITVARAQTLSNTDLDPNAWYALWNNGQNFLSVDNITNPSDYTTHYLLGRFAPR